MDETETAIAAVLARLPRAVDELTEAELVLVRALRLPARDRPALTVLRWSTTEAGPADANGVVTAGERVERRYYWLPTEDGERWANQWQQDAAAGPAESPAATAAPDPHWVERALGLLVAHPTRPVADVAREVGVARRSIYRQPQLKDVLAARRGVTEEGRRELEDRRRGEGDG